MNRIIAAAAALLMALSFSACSSEDESLQENADPSVTSIEASDETTAETKASVTEKDTEIEKTEETTAEKSETEEASATEAETEASSSVTTDAATEAVSEDIFQGDGYTLIIDGEKWMDYSEYIYEISQLAEEMLELENITAEDISKVAKGVYIRKDNLNVNFNIGVTDLGGNVEDIGYDVYRDMMKEHYESQDGVKYIGDEIFDANGIDCLKLTVETTSDDLNTHNKVSQYIFLHGTAQYVFTFTAEYSHYDSELAEFEKIVKSIEFTD